MSKAPAQPPASDALASAADAVLNEIGAIGALDKNGLNLADAPHMASNPELQAYLKGTSASEAGNAISSIAATGGAVGLAGQNIRVTEVVAALNADSAVHKTTQVQKQYEVAMHHEEVQGAAAGKTASVEKGRGVAAMPPKAVAAALGAGQAMQEIVKPEPRKFSPAINTSLTEKGVKSAPVAKENVKVDPKVAQSLSTSLGKGSDHSPAENLKAPPSPARPPTSRETGARSV